MFINSFRLDKTVFLALLVKGKVSLSAFGDGNFSFATTLMLCILFLINFHLLNRLNSLIKERGEIYLI